MESIRMAKKVSRILKRAEEAGLENTIEKAMKFKYQEEITKCYMD